LANFTIDSTAVSNNADVIMSILINGNPTAYYETTGGKTYVIFNQASLNTSDTIEITIATNGSSLNAGDITGTFS